MEAQDDGVNHMAVASGLAARRLYPPEERSPLCLAIALHGRLSASIGLFSLQRVISSLDFAECHDRLGT